MGPFEVGEYKPGAYVLLRRNANYWKHDAQGRKLPYLDTIRLDIQQNRELELLRFRRGELDIVNKLDPDMYERLSAEMPRAAVDAGPSLDMELVLLQSGSRARRCRITNAAASAPPSSGAQSRRRSIATTSSGWCITGARRRQPARCPPPINSGSIPP